MPLKSVKILRGAVAAAFMPWAVMLFKFLFFDVVWCSYTTFKAFSTWQLWACAAVVSLVLVFPSVCFRRRLPQIVVMALTDLWLVANLMYYRTYFSAIPPSSYFLASNLADFMPSVAASLRVVDLVFPLSTVAFALWCRRRAAARIPLLPYFALLVVGGGALAVALSTGGGFRKRYDDLQLSAHLYASGPPMYTPAGHVAHGLLSTRPVLTPDEAAATRRWLDGRPALPPRDSTAAVRDNLVVILAESLESWVIGLTFEGQEITPCLNRLVADSTAFYAPHILTQVKGGRSIDAQLLLLAGLIPVQSGTYSVLYPDHYYPTLPKALHEARGSRSYLLTVDKAKTWNQGAIARAFGIDTLLSYPDFRLTETVGSRKRLGDRAFLSQICEKMERGEVWPEGEPAYVQIVTYSGHAPFRLPDGLRELTFSDDVPELMADYMATARYTDAAIGRFIDYLRSRSDFGRTAVVITGDHEGLAQSRAALCASGPGRGVVSEGQFTPFIVVNAPRGGRVDEVAGQVDMYPTLLSMLGLDDYGWHGVGRSLLDPGRAPVAVGSAMNVAGDTTGCGAEVERLREAHTVSDRILRFDMLAPSR